MKKSILFSVLCVMLLAASPAKAIALADGIWFIPASNQFCSTSVNGNEIISICWDAATNVGGFFRGFFDGNVVTFLGGNAFIALDEVITITSPTTATGIRNICVPAPGYFCALPVGIPFTLEKIF